VFLPSNNYGIWSFQQGVENPLIYGGFS